jgi:hypothetical protein
VLPSWQLSRPDAYLSSIMNQNRGKIRIRIYRIDGDEVTVECLDGASAQTLGQPPYKLGEAPLYDQWRETHDAAAGTTNALLIFKAKNLACLDEYLEGRLLTLSFQVPERQE